MQMTTEEIIRNYTEAKDKSKQIGILADLNGCDKEKIRSILRTKGVPLPTKGRPKKETSTRKTSTKTKKPTSTVEKVTWPKPDPKIEDLVQKDEFESPLRPLTATLNKDGLYNVEFKNIATGEVFTVDMVEAAENFQHRPTLPDKVKELVNERLTQIEVEIMQLNMDKEELEDFLESFNE